MIPHITVVIHNKNGKIVHIHESESYDGRRYLSESEIEDASLELASKINHISRAELAALKVKEEDVQKSVKYEVDLRKRILVVKKELNLSKRKRK